MGFLRGRVCSPVARLSDVSDKAKFSIVIEGREIVIADLPTHVYGATYSKTYSGDRILHSYWLPVVAHLTVLGCLRQKKGSWGQIFRDPKVGLIYSIHTAESTALREVVKGVLGLALVGAGLLATYFMLAKIR